ncbi:hypothetical protein O181_051674 [Austropuccinia psidii MF-1]|uniref:Uncharacterized protein n=1 Tax=Austropuccinia psidii MF-1 TaxID=1389203 RepID=A0A9Q3HQX8_9BASI|nr:hypothetical protein [Austropuccinia psidii MF-1]
MANGSPSQERYTGSDESSLPSASIRPYEHVKDFKFIKFLIGSAILSKTGAANQDLFWSTPFIYLWSIGFTIHTAFRLLFSSDSSHRLGILSPQSLALEIICRLPIFVAPPLVLLLLFNWSHRNHFNSILIQTFSQDDLSDPVRYYQKNDQSGIWILDYDGRQLGVIAVDLIDGEPDDILADRKTMMIRHLAIAIDFKSVGIELDLLIHVLSSAFCLESSIERVAIRLTTPFNTYHIGTLKQLGFRRLNVTQSHSSNQKSCFSKLLIFLGYPNPQQRWIEEIWTLEREQWQIKQKETF